MRAIYAFLLLIALCAPSLAQAVRDPDPSSSVNSQSAKSKSRAGKTHFVEFRARSALSYGHTFAVLGRVGQKITAANVAGLHPATESAVPWMIGHILLVPSETGASDGDIEDQYVTARYRILLTEPEFKKLNAHVTSLKASSPVWHAVLYNCNAFVADIAKSMGLKTPSSTLLMPKDFINELRDLNRGSRTAAVRLTAENQ